MDLDQISVIKLVSQLIATNTCQRRMAVDGLQILHGAEESIAPQEIHSSRPQLPCIRLSPIFQLMISLSPLTSYPTLPLPTCYVSSLQDQKPCSRQLPRDLTLQHRVRASIPLPGADLNFDNIEEFLADVA